MALLKRDLGSLANDHGGIGSWLAKAMESFWEKARLLIQNPELADILGKHHRIIVND